MTAISRRRPADVDPLMVRLRVAFARHVGRHTARAVARREQQDSGQSFIRIRRKSCPGPCPCHPERTPTVRVRAVVLPGETSRSAA